MLAPMLASIHNLHYYVNLMREAREALDAGRFGDFARQFKVDRDGFITNIVLQKQNQGSIAETRGGQGFQPAPVP